MHRGLRGRHSSRPSRIRCTWKASTRSGGTICASNSCAFSAEHRSGTSPSRLLTLRTCVSTGSTGKSHAKSNTQAAVFGPIPSIWRRVSCASRQDIFRRARRSARPNFSIAHRTTRWIRGAFWLARPATRMAAAISSVEESAMSSHFGNRRRNSAKARSVLRSAVFCERIVKISSLNGSYGRGLRAGP